MKSVMTTRKLFKSKQEATFTFKKTYNIRYNLKLTEFTTISDLTTYFAFQNANNKSLLSDGTVMHKSESDIDC